MKKFVLILLCVVLLAGAGVGGWLWYSWQNTTFEKVEVPAAQVNGHPATLTRYDWRQPVMEGFAWYKDYTWDADLALEPFRIETETPSLSLELTEGWDTTLTLVRNGENTVYGGPPSQFEDSFIYEDGDYQLSISFAKAGEPGEASGYFLYEIPFTVLKPPPPEPEIPDEPELQVGRTGLQQGDILAVKLMYLPEGVVPTASTNLGMAVFAPIEHGWFLSVPIGNTRAPGSYTVQLAAGEQQWTVDVTVEAFEFDEQNLIIDTSDPVISEANSPAAYEEYRNKIPPLFETADEERYWNGRFIQPVEGRISTNFGEIRYTNSDFSNPRPHYGMDIAAAEGTPVAAPNAGRVVLAEYLLNTGNTVVIEHGGGLKSYYFHMVELNVEPEQMVDTGDIIGAVGTTGYSTGPHLHFEMRIGNQAISPQMLLEPGAGLYSLEPEKPAAEEAA